MRWLALPLLAVVVVMFAPLGAFAHSLDATYKIDAAGVHIEAFYDTDDAAAKIAIRALDAAGQLIAEGQTDDRGHWTFPRPPAGKYKIDLNAGIGHRKILFVSVPVDPTIDMNSAESRAERTRFPWLGLTVGLIIIAGLSLGARWWLRTSTDHQRAGMPSS